MTFLAVMDASAARRYLVLSAVGHYSLMPLLFRVSPEPLWLVRPDTAPELEAAKE